MFFDYIKSEAAGLDSKAVLIGRQSTLEYINNSVDIVRGTFNNFEESIGLYVGIKNRLCNSTGGVNRKLMPDHRTYFISKWHDKWGKELEGALL